MLGQNLKQLWESHGPQACIALLSEGLSSGDFKPDHFSLRELAEAFCGHDWVSRLNPRNMDRFGPVPLQEAGEGVDVSAFSNITGQIFYNKILEGWKNAGFIGDRCVQTIPTNLDGEKMPWLSHVGSEGEGLQPGQPYPEASFGERYIETPSTTKQGFIVSVTKEMIFFDRTGQAMRAAAEVGYKLGYNKEKQILDLVLGQTNNYKLNGTTYNTYLATDPPTDNTHWLNQKSGVPLTDYTALDTAFQLSQKVLDPDTGNPLADAGLFTDLLVMPYRYITARRIVHATGVQQAVPGFATSGNPTKTDATNEALPWTLEPFTSPILYQRAILASGFNKTATQANEYWMVGQFKKAFAWMENWPLTTVQAPANNIKEFEQDIIVRHKASFRGVPAVLEPRYVFQFYNT